MTTTVAEPAPVLDPLSIRRVFGHHPSGVVAIAARIDGVEEVIIASSFTVGVSLDPPLVLFAVQNSSTTWPLLRRADSLGMSGLAASQGDLCRQLASKERSARWGGVQRFETTDGALVLDGAALALEGRIHSEHLAGDHSIVVVELTAVDADHEVDPLLFHGSRFRPLG